MHLNLPSPARRRRRLAVLLVLLSLHVAASVLLARLHHGAGGPRVRTWEVRGDRFFLDGEPFLLMGVGWDPARPGELPWTRAPDLALAAHDFARMVGAGFNTVRTWDAMSPAELALAHRMGLAVVQGTWVEPDGDFTDPDFRRRKVEQVSAVARASRDSGAVLGYLVMNEPPPAHVLAQGLDVTRAFLRELRAGIRAEHPGALVGFSSWPGLEFLDEPELDFVAVNLHPFRPTAALAAVAYEGMLDAWKQLAGGRPLLVSEFGASVAPNAPAPDEPGGLTASEQAGALTWLTDAVVRRGAAGGAVFSWNDGWWKPHGHASDEHEHDADDGEEWFGLIAFDGPEDRAGRPRPALAALRRAHRAVVTRPRDGRVDGRVVDVEVHAPYLSDLQVEATFGGATLVVPVERHGHRWRGRLGLDPRAGGGQVIELAVTSPAGAVLTRTTRTVFPPGEALNLALQGVPGGILATVHDDRGRPVAGAEVKAASLGAVTGRHGQDRAFTDAHGRTRLELGLPRGETLAVVLASVRAPHDGPPLAVAVHVVADRDAP